MAKARGVSAAYAHHAAGTACRPDRDTGILARTSEWRSEAMQSEGERPRRSAPLRLRNHARVLAVALDVDALTDLQVGIQRLRDLHEHAVAQTNDDLLPGFRLIALLLYLVAEQRTAKRARDHRDVATRAAADQAANPETAEAADDGTKPAMLVGRQIELRDLLDHALANLH